MEKAVQGRDQLLKAREAVIAKRDEEKKILIEKIQVLTDRYQALDSDFVKLTGLKEKAERERGRSFAKTRSRWRSGLRRPGRSLKKSTTSWRRSAPLLHSSRTT